MLRALASFRTWALSLPWASSPALYVAWFVEMLLMKTCLDIPHSLRLGTWALHGILLWSPVHVRICPMRTGKDILGFSAIAGAWVPTFTWKVPFDFCAFHDVHNCPWWIMLGCFAFTCELGLEFCGPFVVWMGFWWGNAWVFGNCRSIIFISVHLRGFEFLSDEGMLGSWPIAGAGLSARACELHLNSYTSRPVPSFPW